MPCVVTGKPLLFVIGLAAALLRPGVGRAADRPLAPPSALAAKVASAAPSGPSIVAPVAAEPLVRVRGTRKGLLLGALGGLGTGGALFMLRCFAFFAAIENPCGDDLLSTGLVHSVAGLLVGSALGANVGAAIPRSFPAGYQPRWWETATGELGALSLHAGVNHVLDRQDAPAAAGALRVAFLLKLGPFFAVGPELAAYGQSHAREAVVLGPAGEPEPTPKRLLLFVSSLTAQAGLPLGRLRPHLLASFGLLASGQANLGGSVGVGVEWRLLSRLGLGAEARFYSELQRQRERFVTTTAGTTVHW